jgi:DNA-directed RNA polymerase sigma subunit (sigma70/sigma32)
MSKLEDNPHGQISLTAYLQFIAEINRISVEKENELLLGINDSDNESFRELVKANLWLVVSVAKQYQDMGLGLHQLILVGNVGLISAVKRLSNANHPSFKAYASGWIRQSILQAITEHFWISKLSLSENGYKHKIDKVLHQLNSNFLSEPIIYEALDV